MVFVRFSYITAMLLSFGVVFFGTAIADEYINSSRSIFNFHKELAAEGKLSDMYELGFMYEMGEGTEVDLAEAKKCYQAAAAQGYYSPANLRLIYFDVKANGYDKEKHAKWLQVVKIHASGTVEQSFEALFLLGQLYYEGLGVKKDLKKALEIMYRLSMAGYASADIEISKIDAEIVANQRKKTVTEKKLSNVK